MDRGASNERTTARPVPSPPSSAPRPRPSSGEQLTDELWSRARSSLPAYFAIMAIAWPIVRGAADGSRAVIGAYAAAVFVGLARWIAALLMVPRLARVRPKVRHRAMLAGATAAGLSMGLLGALLYPRLAPLDLGLWITFLAGTAGGATISLGARPEIFLVYALPMLGTFVVMPFVSPREGGTPVAVGMAVWIVYALVQVVQYRKTRVELIRANEELDTNARALHDKNRALERAQRDAETKNRELEAKNRELVEMTQRADRIFSALAEALPGTTLAGKYKLESRIGAGGFSVVFRAMHVGLQRAVAVKIFRPQAGNDTAAALERFRHEGMTNSLLQHPNVVQVLDAGVSEDGIPYIAMELLDGHSLDAELSAGALPLARATEVMGQVCLGLAAAHASGVIHRDVKPENIFLHREHGREVVKLLDFGIAKVKGGDRVEDAHMTSTGMLIGTPLYMAPERLLGRECDASADVYSVGIILYQALAGRLPYQGTLGEIMMQAVSQRPVELHDLAPDVPRDLAARVMRALADDPAERPPVTELADALARAHAAPAAAVDVRGAPHAGRRKGADAA